MFKPQSDYALNKMDPDAIVYIDPTGTITRLTRGDFTNEEEFLSWKSWSDKDYHMSENMDHIFYNHTRSLQHPDDKSIAVQSPENTLIETQEQQVRQKLCCLLMKGMDSHLTQTQRRRLWLYCVDGLTENEIALVESVKQQSITKLSSLNDMAVVRIGYLTKNCFG